MMRQASVGYGGGSMGLAVSVCKDMDMMETSRKDGVVGLRNMQWIAFCSTRFFTDFRPGHDAGVAGAQDEAPSDHAHVNVPMPSVQVWPRGHGLFPAPRRRRSVRWQFSWRQHGDRRCAGNSQQSS